MRCVLFLPTGPVGTGGVNSPPSTSVYVTDRPANKLRVGDDPFFGMVVDPATRTLYVVNAADDTVPAVNTERGNATRSTACSRTSATIQTGNSPQTNALDPTTATLYVTHALDNTVSVLNADSCMDKRELLDL